MSATEIAAGVRGRELSASEVTDAFLRRIEAVNGHLNAVVVPLFESARAAAAAIDETVAAGAPVGPLAGVPITVKESFDVRGTPTTAGLTARKDHIATADALMVSRLRQAGAVLLGKTNVPPLLLSTETDNPLYGRTSNPWDLERAPGGSSGGEAAILASRGSALGLGSDMGGSVRVPAHACGIHALRPTAGRLSMHGHFACMAGNEAILVQPGPMARSVADLSLAMSVLAGPDQSLCHASVPPVPWSDPSDVPLSKLRIAYYTDSGVFRPSPAIRRAVRQAADALAAMGIEVEEWRGPNLEEAWDICVRLMVADGMKGPWRALKGSQLDRHTRSLLGLSTLPRSVLVAWALLSAALGQRHVSQGLRRLRSVPAQEYFQLVQRRNDFRARFYAELHDRQIDALLCPADALVAIPHGASQYLGDALSYTAVYSLLGMPAGVVSLSRVQEGEVSDRPRSFDLAERAAKQAEQGTAGLPVGVQVVARHWREDVALAVMSALEHHYRNRAEYPREAPL
ncbi:MAG: amidase [Bryobacteraceae bacterium]